VELDRIHLSRDAYWQTSSRNRVSQLRPIDQSLEACLDVDNTDERASVRDDAPIRSSAATHS
jgi:hypothetical protein